MHETLSLNPGLILLHYKKQSGQANAVIRPIIPAESRGAITILFDPGTHNDALTTPGEVCVLRCDRQASLVLEITSNQHLVPPRGSIEVEYISQPRRRPETRVTESAPTAARREPIPALDYFAHFHLLGDQPGAFGAWLQGDGTSQGIEGICIQPTPGMPRIMMRDRVSGQVAAPGEFLGTRGRFRPLTELEIWLDELSSEHVIRVEALFRNAGRVEQSGSFLTLRGIEPDEKLLGINLRVQPRQPQPQATAEPSFQSTRRQQLRNERVKIFRK